MSTDGSNTNANNSSPSLSPATLTRLANEGAQTLDFLVQERVAVERTTTHRTFHQVLERNGTVLPDQWWQVLSDAASALQLRPAVLDCSVDQLIRLVDEGADVALLVSDTTLPGVTGPGWIVIRGQSGTKVSWWESITGEYTILKRSRRLRKRLLPLREDERIRCVAFDWRETSMQTVQSPTAAMKPLTRVIHLLRPEWSDIWLVMVFAFVVGLLSLATPIAVESLVSTVSFGRFLQPIVVLAFVLLTFLGFSAAIRALQTYIVEIVQQRLFARIAGDLAHRMPRVSIEGNDEKYLPELANRFFDVVTVQKVAASLLLDGISLVLGAGIGMAVLGFYHPFLLGFDALLLAAIAFIIIVLGRGAVNTAVKESKSKYYMAAWLEDVSRCQTTFHSAAGKRLSACRADRMVHDYLVNRKKHFRVLLRQIIFALGLQALASTALLGLGGYLVIIGELTLGQLVAAELIVTVIVGAFAKLGKHMESYYDLLASVDKLGALFDLPLARQGSILHASTDEAVTVDIDQVTYARSGGKPIFSPLTVSIPAEGSMAILGPSGTGKSTLLDLIYGTRRPKTGQIKVDGSQPSDMQSDDFWSHVELTRDGEIFSGTIEENIHLQRNDVSGKEVEAALAQVGLLKKLSALPQGLQTALNSGGAPLPTNQIRLLLIARAIAAQPDLMMVDGILDSLSDEELDPVLNALFEPENPWTLVIATGRRSIAERCSQIVHLPSSDVVTHRNEEASC